MLPKHKIEQAKVIHLNLRPSEEEVSEYIQTKMCWPKSFSEYYGSKFWNFYESKGWMIGKNSMKNWKAAFNGQWQTIKDQRDEMKLTQALRKQAEETARNSFKIESSTNDVKNREFDYINDILESYFEHPTWVTNETLSPIYDFLKINKLICLDKSECEICRSMGEIKGKAQAVKFLFDRMIKEQKTFI